MKSTLDLYWPPEDFPNADSDNYFTPPWVFENLAINFDLDVCAPSIPLPWIPAKKTLSIIDDGLTHEWAGKVWMNPPYSNPLPWIRKFIEHGDGVALVPTTTGDWMLQLWEADSAWVILPPMRFVLSTRVPAKGALPSRCWLVAMGPHCIRKLRAADFGKVRMT